MVTSSTSCHLQPIEFCRAETADNIEYHVADYIFRCSYCIKLIGEDAAVYMRCDHSYCSSTCRDKGLSRLYMNLKERQLCDGLGKSSAGWLASSANWKSDSSMSSKTTTTQRTGQDDAEGGRKTQPRSVFARLGQRVLDVMLQRVESQSWGTQVMQTYSSGMLWGKDFTKNSSVQALFDYPPEVDPYLEPSMDDCSHFSKRTPSVPDFEQRPVGFRRPSAEYISGCSTTVALAILKEVSVENINPDIVTEEPGLIPGHPGFGIYAWSQRPPDVKA